MVINAPSLANIPLLDFPSQVQELYDAGVRFFHVDIMDGHYVPNLCFPTSLVGELKEKYPDCTVEVHLMVDDPFRYIDQMKALGADWLSFHCDSTRFVRRGLTMIRAAGMRAGVVLNPSQQVSVLEPYGQLLDYVVFMSVEPGFAGQKFLPGSMERLRELSAFRRRQGLSFSIIVDGGVSYANAAEAVRAGADALVTNIYMIFRQKDGITAACQRFRRELEGVAADI